MDLDLDPEAVGRARSALAAWYDRGHRALPWREGRDPYRILVSELMLVQTTVAAAVPYFARFLARFPTVEALAGAEEVEVLRVWEGLGYYRRARQLHAAAKVIVGEYGGKIPADPALIRALPGVGRYIAGAVASFAFDLPEPILEANTQRVLARLLAWGQDLKAPASQRRLWEAAARLVPSVQPGRFNQAIMELGATVCTARVPSCLICPLATDCAARLQGRQDILPIKTIKPKLHDVVEACAVVHDDRGRVRMAAVDLRFRRLTVCPPIGKHRQYPALSLTVLHADERGAPEGREPIRWRLPTNRPVDDLAGAIEKLDWYSQRWKIEVCQADYVSSDTLYRRPESSHSGCLGVIGAGPMVSSTPRSQPGTTVMRRHIERHLPPRLGIIRDARSA